MVLPDIDAAERMRLRVLHHVQEPRVSPFGSPDTLPFILYPTSLFRSILQNMATPLANGWVQATAPDGRTYYANTATGATSWEFPAE